MKTMTCKQLGGACNKKFRASTFEEIIDMSKKHGFEMFQKGDKAHMKVMGEVQKLANSPKAMNDWLQEKKELFESFPEEK